MIKLIIYGEPQPQGRPRFSRRGNFVTTYDPPKSKAYKALVKRQALAQWHSEPLQGALACKVKVYRPIQKSGSKRQKELKEAGVIRPVQKPDVDNYFKGVTDPLTGIVWEDDNQIVHAEIDKYYSNEPRIELEIEGLEQ